jgi:glycosyltransferase involved in cell wall biosynthesis
MIELSVIIPTFNRAAQLRICLLALARQTLAASEYEVIVVVDGSTDGTRQTLADLSVPYALKVFWQANAGQCAARNLGAAEASGRYCVFLDDDIIASPALLGAHLRAQQEREGIVGVGRLIMRPLPAAGGFVRGFSQMWNSHYDRLNQGLRPPAWRDCYSGNLAVSRAAFLDLGGFATDLPARFDIELGYRLERHGLTFVYVHAAAGEHDDYKTFHGLATDEERQGRASVEICRRHPAMLPFLLGTFGETTVRAILLRRLFLALNLSSLFLALLSKLADNRAWAYEWYSFLHSYFYWRGVRHALPDRATWRRLTYRTPILMYHAFGGAGEPASRFVVPQRKFALQMAWLKWMRYRVLSLEEYLSCHREHQFPPARSVVITIDDGYADTRTRAYPVLRRHGFQAIVFIVSAEVGNASHWGKNGPLVGRPLLAWPDIQEMLPEGISFGAHTRTHPILTAISLEQAQEEISGSRADLEQKLNLPIGLFAYPFGKYDSKIQALVQQAGFLGACSVHRGPNTPNTIGFALHRTEVAGTDSIVRFALGLLIGDEQLPPRRSTP